MTDHRKKLLIIDSDEKLLDRLEICLGNRGFGVTTATEGRQGLRQLYRDRPDLVILETTLPGMDGWEVCQRIRDVSNVPIILLTALEQEGEALLKLVGDQDPAHRVQPGFVSGSSQTHDSHMLDG